MIEMRWLVNNDNSRRLQYRVYIDHTVYALPAGVPQPKGHETMRWSMWRDVPEVFESPKYGSNQCPQCGLDFTGPMGYACPHPQCPTGLGGSHS